MFYSLPAVNISFADFFHFLFKTYFRNTIKFQMVWIQIRILVQTVKKFSKVAAGKERVKCNQELGTRKT